MNDDELRRMFAQNRPDLPGEPGFQREVWKKIERQSEMMSLPYLVKISGDFLTRPSLGIPLALAAIVCSAWLAIHNGMEARDETWTKLGLSYNEVINPITHHRPE
ncbi:MAG: hypothetical protein P1U89_17180 [Verrucomicrobiales bacterium]|nr:hypothetical protein [Verrucomicrobiales bacterium]